MGASSRKLLPTAGHAATNSVGAASRRGVYVYCVVRGATKPTIALPEARLPHASAPRVLPLGVRTWLVVADVPLDIYGEQAVERRIQELDWVAAIGVAHQAMVDACMGNDAVVPMKVFTIFTSVKRARHEMRRHGDRLRMVMHQVAGCVEWGVRVTRAPQPARDLQRMITQRWMQPAGAPDGAPSARSVRDGGGGGAPSARSVRDGGGGGAPSARPVRDKSGDAVRRGGVGAAKRAARASSAAADASLEGEGGGGSGRAFLQAKARQRDAVRVAAAVLNRQVRELADTLGEVTRDVRYREPTRSTVPVLLDASYLVPRQAQRRFRAQVRIKSQPLLARGCRVTVTGPWPAYSFVSPAGRSHPTAADRGEGPRSDPIAADRAGGPR